jgi:hypothetical protein
MELYGKDQFKIEYYNNSTWFFYETDMSRYSSKYVFNLTESINLKNILGGQLTMVKGNHHRFSVMLLKPSKDEFNIFKILNIINGFRFYPHKDNIGKYYTVNLVKFNPIYTKNQIYCDELELVFETDKYQELGITSKSFSLTEAYRMSTWNEIGINGHAKYFNQGADYLAAGKFGNCIKLPTGNYWFYINNYESKPVTNDESFTFSTWFKCGVPSEISHLIGIGTAFMLIRINAYYNIYVGGAIIATAPVTTFPDNQWHNLQVIFSGNQAYVFIDTVFIGNGTRVGHASYPIEFGKTPWVGIDYNRPCDLYIDDTYYHAGLDESGNEQVWSWNSGAGNTWFTDRIIY